MKTLYSALALLMIHGPAFGITLSGGDYEITKTLSGAFGSEQMTAGEYALAFTMAEPMAGHRHGSDPEVISGYLGGSFGAAIGLQLVRSQIGPRAFFQDTLQVGVPFDAVIDLEFSEGLAPGTLTAGIHVWKLLNHRGEPETTWIDAMQTYDSLSNTVRLSPATPLESNSLYEIRITQDLLSVDGFTVDGLQRIRFVTLLDPALDNVVLYPLIDSLGAPALGAASVFTAGGISIQIPADALPEQSMVLINETVQREALEEANRKARAAAGPYRTPIKLQEINAFNANGERVATLAKPVDIAFSFQTQADGQVQGAQAPVRAQTLSLWTLDEKHKLWVKIPGSRAVSEGLAISAAVPHFSVYALMGAPSGSAADTFAFPVPWRPHGPMAGDSNGQTGTLAGGITFTNLPSECTIRLYTIAGELVRTLHHSDLNGSIAQERWDVRTDGGDAVASGVYLWRVESDVDGKNGKLMVIR